MTPDTPSFYLFSLDQSVDCPTAHAQALRCVTCGQKNPLFSLSCPLPLTPREPLQLVNRNTPNTPNLCAFEDAFFEPSVHCVSCDSESSFDFFTIQESRLFSSTASLFSASLSAFFSHTYLSIRLYGQACVSLFFVLDAETDCKQINIFFHIIGDCKGVFSRMTGKIQRLHQPGEAMLPTRQMRVPKMDSIQQRVVSSFAPATTVEILRQAIRDMRTPRVHSTARFLVRGVASTNKHPIAGRLSEVAVIEQFVRRCVRYTRDPYMTELVHSPALMLQRIEEYGAWSEDCESMAGLTIALLMSIGHRCRLTIVGFHQPGSYTHIFCESFIPRVGWVVVDPSVPNLERSREMIARIRHIEHFYPEQVMKES